MGRAATKGSGRLSPEMLAVARRERRVVELRRGGMSFDRIAVEVGYANRGGAKKAFDRALLKWPVDAPEEMRRVELLRLDALIVVVWPWLYDERLDRRLTAVGLLDDIAGQWCDLTLSGRYVPCPDDTHPQRVRADAFAAGLNPSGVGEWTSALALRERGLSFDEVAVGLGVSGRGAARRRVERDLALYMAGPVDGLRAVVLVELEGLFRELWADVTGPKPLVRDVRTVLRVMKRRAKLLQLYPDPSPAGVRRRRKRLLAWRRKQPLYPMILRNYHDDEAMPY